MNKHRLIQLFLLVLAIFLSFKVVPMAGEWKASLGADIERLMDRRDQLNRLLDSREEWRRRLEKLTSSEATLSAKSLPGDRPEVASARLQSLLRGYADEAGVEISSLSLPEIEVVGAWHLLQQVVVTRGTEAAVLGFLERVESGEKLLRVVEFNMRETGANNLQSSATVVGFFRCRQSQRLTLMSDLREINLTMLEQVLLSQGMVPAEDYESSGTILCTSGISGTQQQKVRFMLSGARHFQTIDNEAMERAIRFWRAELSPGKEDGDTGEEALEADEEHLKEIASDAPVIRLVNHFIARALDLSASDVHFEPEENGLEVRARVDGVMVKLDSISAAKRTAVASRLKLMARMDIGEKRLPQDGRISFPLGGKRLDLRVSTLPGVHGESIVLRILDRGDLGADLDSLGMPPGLLARYNAMIQQPNGMILITGPTGSGKTTTLYATLDKLNTGTQKIITVEDPVEYQLPGVTQVQVNSAIGLTFATGLRSIVRQDPDIILIGEIRDQETADIASESALTGHLVFSTLHTNDAAGAVSRLIDMGVEPYLISASLLAVQAQRLVRRICPHCIAEHPLQEEEAQVLNLSRQTLPVIKRGGGCENCGGTGYRGRIGLYELMPFSSAIRRLVNSGADTDAIREQAVTEGMITLRQDALDKLKLGITTPEEVIRVTSARH